MLETQPSAAVGAQATVLHRAIVARIQEVERLFWELGQYVRAMHDARLYEALGHDTFASWLADPEVNLSVSQAYRLMACDKAFSPLLAAVPNDGKPALVTRDDLAAIGVARAELVAPFISAEDPERSADWLGKARELSVSDLRRAVQDERRGRGLDDRGEWLRDVSFQLAAIARRLPEAPDPLVILDDLSSRILAVRARLEGQRHD